MFRLKNTDLTQFLSHIILKLTCKVVQLNKRKNLQILEFCISGGGLIERGGLFQILTQRGGAY